MEKPHFPTADVAEIRVGATTICMGHILDLGDMSIGERPAGSEQKNTADKVGAMCQCMYVPKTI